MDFSTSARVFFRGFFFYRFEEILGRRGGVLASGLLFGFYHVMFGSAAAVPAAAVGGLFLALVYVATRSLAISWAMHVCLGLAAYSADFAHYFTTVGGGASS